MDILTNPIVISVVVMSALCLMKMNVLLAILISGVIAGLTGGMDLPKTFRLYRKYGKDLTPLLLGWGETRKRL